jgi:hypothetical protein
VRPLETKNEALRLVDLGLNDCEIARRLEVPRTTVRDWRAPSYIAQRPKLPCPRCGRLSRPIVLRSEPYAELLGLYLGDVHITQMARSQRLRLFLDAKYPEIVDEAEEIVRALLPFNRVGRLAAEEGRMAVIWAYSSHLGCLFPQHGAGKKHDRPIVMESWQQELIEDAPWAFLRGCIRSDGCVFVNRTGRYEYLSYDFSNRSQDILDLFERTCVALGLRPCRAPWRVRLNRREDVARLLDHVGRKA